MEMLARFRVCIIKKNQITNKPYIRTPHIEDNDFFSENQENHLVGLMDIYLLKDVRTYIFGADQPSCEAAKTEAEKRGFDLTVYIMGSDANEVQKLCKVISSVPSRIFLFQRNDFFREGEGMYATMGIDRLAALRGASAHCGFPALVIDGTLQIFIFVLVVHSLTCSNTMFSRHATIDIL